MMPADSQAPANGARPLFPNDIDMLTALRSKATSWIVKILFLLLIGSFGVWGVGDMLRQGGSEPAVAEIGPVKITGQQYMKEFHDQVNRLQPRFQGRLDNDLARQLGLPKVVLDQMVGNTLLDVEADRLHLVMPDAVIQQLIFRGPAFKNQAGQFDPSLFQSYLQQQQLNEATFVRNARTELIRTQMLNGIIAGAAAPKTLADLIYAYRAEKRVASTILVASSSITDVGQPDEKTLADFLKENAARYQSPEYRAVTLVRMSPEDVAGDIVVGEDEVSQEFQPHANDMIPEQRHLEQIIFPDEAAAEAAADRIKAGQSFADAAQKATGKAPGDLGTVAKNEMLPALAGGAFDAPDGGVTAPMKTGFGWHLLHVAKVVPAHKAALAEMHDKIKADIVHRKAVDALNSLTKQFDDELASGDSLEKAAEKLRLKVQKVASVDGAGRGADGKPVEGVADNQAILAAIGATPGGQTTDISDAGGDSYFILKVDGVTPAAVRPLADVRDLLIADWQHSEREKQAAAKATKLAERLRAGEDFAKLATELGVPVKTSTPFLRTIGDPAANITPDAATKLFAAKVGEAITAAAADGQVVAKLDRIDPANPASDQATVDKLRESLRQGLAGDLVTEYGNALRQKIPVNTDYNQLDKLF
jgi:peptidyl-prolyl cis-trans isomerase D